MFCCLSFKPALFCLLTSNTVWAGADHMYMRSLVSFCILTVMSQAVPVSHGIQRQRFLLVFWEKGCTMKFTKRQHSSPRNNYSSFCVLTLHPLHFPNAFILLIKSPNWQEHKSTLTSACFCWCRTTWRQISHRLGIRLLASAAVSFFSFLLVWLWQCPHASWVKGMWYCLFPMAKWFFLNLPLLLSYNCFSSLMEK